MPLSEIMGHDRVVEVLQRSLRSGKTAHAYIFEGPCGCGRRKTALALIQALFCHAVSDDACGVCASCRKVAGGNHGDIHIVEPLPDKRDINIAQLRDVQRALAMRPYEAPRSACIVEPADRMNNNSANSFLKTLEEPPGNAIIILITENADMLLPTIRSRCQLVRFAPLSPEHIGLLLERNGMDAENAALLAPLADGSMQRALELDNDALALRREQLVKHLSTLSLDRIVTVFDAAEELSGNRDETLDTIDMLLSFSRDMLHLAAGCGDVINTTIQPLLEGLVIRLKLQGVLQLADDILETRRSVQRNANAKLALDHLFIRIAGALAS
ncbi:MAG: DNA polymerase III subunit delta' [Desulfuromonadales bacterium]|nr:DNA polymerase III subunit delta' [Desulfuromonadales bacterium]